MLKKIDYLGKLNDLKMARKDASRAMEENSSPVDSMIKEVGKKKD